YTRLAAEKTAGDLDHAIVGEQVDDVVPHPTMDIVGESVLQVADVILIVERANPLGKRRDVGTGVGSGPDGIRNRDAGLVDSEVIGDNRQILLPDIAHPSLVTAFVLRKMVQRGDLPASIFEDIVVLVQSALQPGPAPAVAAQRKDAPPPLGGLPVDREIDEGIVDELGIERPRVRHRGALLREPPGNLVATPDRAVTGLDPSL